MAGEIDNLLIDTPENVILEAEIAGFGSRCMAAIIDYIIILILLLGFSCLFMGAVSDDDTDRDILIAIYFLIQFLLITFYHLFFEFAWNGQTPGKRRLNIRIVQANGMPPTTSSILVRNLVRLFDFLPLFYGIGLVSLFITPRTQRLGDLAARTIVIRENKQLTLATVREDYSVRYEHISRHDPVPTDIDITKLTANDRRRVVDFLQRRDELDNQNQIAEMLARQMAKRMEVTLPNRHSLACLRFLEHIARAFEIADYNASQDRPT